METQLPTFFTRRYTVENNELHASVVVCTLGERACGMRWVGDLRIYVKTVAKRSIFVLSGNGSRSSSLYVITLLIELSQQSRHMGV